MTSTGEKRDVDKTSLDYTMRRDLLSITEETIKMDGITIHYTTCSRNVSRCEKYGIIAGNTRYLHTVIYDSKNHNYKIYMHYTHGGNTYVRVNKLNHCKRPQRIKRKLYQNWIGADECDLYNRYIKL